MHDATTPPKRMLYSFEARCRAVSAMRSGISPAKAAASVGASRASGYRWWARYRARGWAGLRERPSTPRHQPRRLSPAEEAEIVAARERSGAGWLRWYNRRRPHGSLGSLPPVSRVSHLCVKYTQGRRSSAGRHHERAPHALGAGRAGRDKDLHAGNARLARRAARHDGTGSWWELSSLCSPG